MFGEGSRRRQDDDEGLIEGLGEHKRSKRMRNDLENRRDHEENLREKTEESGTWPLKRWFRSLGRRRGEVWCAEEAIVRGRGQVVDDHYGRVKIWEGQGGESRVQVGARDRLEEPSAGLWTWKAET